MKMFNVPLKHWFVFCFTQINWIFEYLFNFVALFYFAARICRNNSNRTWKKKKMSKIKRSTLRIAKTTNDQFHVVLKKICTSWIHLLVFFCQYCSIVGALIPFTEANLMVSNVIISWFTWYEWNYTKLKNCPWEPILHAHFNWCVVSTTFHAHRQKKNKTKDTSV